ncbi:2-phospho-L-lactate transferase [Vibrio pectenicida]|uniref:2-phospho-L-lactate transferase n=1 Tax=Vibrio pectenicida TaxID=62763 RepID=A0A7Y4A026_9VIBR|nr:2-phospho-L-lactate transferase CofD family protein [Vibrio pectenicida]NOH72117.1 2-phospho-L-lactate transferase [Vibrio pectenicida]
MSGLSITLLAGGVGGAKAAEGLVKSCYADGLKIIGNVGDDQQFHGLWVSPDIDTLIYTLSERIDRNQGWGLAGDKQKVLSGLKQLGVDTWMQLGDMDFATHIFRTEQRRLGVRAQKIVEQIARANGINIPILLPTDDIVQTKLKSGGQWLSFQDYFVRLRCQAKVDEIRYLECDKASATPESIEALSCADLVLIAPSNPLLSIGSILSIGDIRTQIQSLSKPIVAISPLIGSQAIKGPAVELMQSLGYSPNVLGIATYYCELIDVLVIDPVDEQYALDIEAMGVQVVIQNIWMCNEAEKIAVMTSIVDQIIKLPLKKVS